MEIESKRLSRIPSRRDTQDWYGAYVCCNIPHN